MDKSIGKKHHVYRKQTNLGQINASSLAMTTLWWSPNNEKVPRRKKLKQIQMVRFSLWRQAVADSTNNICNFFLKHNRINIRVIYDKRFQSHNSTTINNWPQHTASYRIGFIRAWSHTMQQTSRKCRKHLSNTNWIREVQFRRVHFPITLARQWRKNRLCFKMASILALYHQDRIQRPIKVTNSSEITRHQDVKENDGITWSILLN